jgi:hypothetical protein
VHHGTQPIHRPVGLVTLESVLTGFIRISLLVVRVLRGGLALDRGLLDRLDTGRLLAVGVLFLLLLLGPSSTPDIATTEADPRIESEGSLARTAGSGSEAPFAQAAVPVGKTTGEEPDERSCRPSAEPLLVPPDGQFSWPDEAATDDSFREGTGDRDLSLPPASLVPSHSPPVPLEKGDFADDADGGTDKLYWQTNLFMRIVRDQPYLVTKWWPQEFPLGFASPSSDRRGAGGVDVEPGGMGAGSGPQPEGRRRHERRGGSVSHAFSALGNVGTAALR